MATESPIRMLESTDKWTSRKQSPRYGQSSAKNALEDFGFFLQGQRFPSLEKDVVPSRSESAPPSMEGSIAAIENMFSQRKSPFRTGSVNPRLSGINSETDLLFHADPSSSSSSFHATDGSLDQKFGGRFSNSGPVGESVRLHRSSLPAHEEESEDDGSSEHSASVSVEKATSMGYSRSSLDSTQEEPQHASSPSHDQYSSTYKPTEESLVSDTIYRIRNLSVSIPAASTANASLSDDTGQVPRLDSTVVNNPSIHETAFIAVKTDTGKLHKENVKISPNSESHKKATSQESGTSQVQGSSYSQIMYPGLGQAYGSLNHYPYGPSTSEVQPLSGFAPYATTAGFVTSPNPFYPNMQPAGFFSPQYSMSGYPFNPAVLPSYMAGYPPQGTSFDNTPFSPSGVPAGVGLHAYDMQKFYGQYGNPVQPPSPDAFHHLQYFQQPVRDSYGNFDIQTPRGVPQVNSRDSRKGSELIGLSNEHKPQYSAGVGYGNLNVRSKHVSGHYSFGSPTSIVPLVQFPATSVVSPVAQAKSPGRSNVPGGRYNMSHSHTLSGNPNKSFGFQTQNWSDMNSYSFLEELKSGKGQRFELSDITGHIGEFSVDQHGSRFIQQKLEICSDEEKASVFKEVIPHASKLITDVFGNYVIQKLFDYGSPEQRRDLADQLEGQILPLSLQMYGCRVIQKALEVIDLEQKARLVRELDGHVMRCVRDQNGNHVIQKCIESIPANNIYFIISSFRGQVASLSMHPYGCRVIQRVLEHCHDEQLTQFIVDEIMDSVCSLAQDQYGNYVTQHVLERGKSRERSEIIQKLAGSVVQLSQHKFASNVVEKCLEYSDSTARDTLLKEIVGDGDKSDNLLIMMKDQYANYVIQKILQKCTSEQREMLLGLIRNHLVSLKKYTYGKHIVARFEQLYGEEIETAES